ncbi:hypothetical protein SAMN04489761_3016 [Tenacibaculum sp. MAR_2009_124]|uniref:hypothetical protein n=1 Tax=Tenacibaculum sp. MAR_2009_124 TaxID=1250059 RepID=UPI0008988CB7|nr:hypothetical protein [Tenacibaculum sp. MAR_2009_124]SEC44688.1 hypothetical protein SAMN04489761_3016 [Tenacibaculum sp. MAR_2009_124]
MIEEHPYFSRFQLVKQTNLSKHFKFKNLLVKLFEEPKKHVKSVSVHQENGTVLIKDMFYSNTEELIFILNRVPEVLYSCPKDISSQSIVAFFGQNCKPKNT